MSNEAKQATGRYNGLLIDPSDDSITNVVIETWPDILAAIGCKHADVLRLANGVDCVYVDDNGYQNGAGISIGFFLLREYAQPLAGRGLVLGSTHDGKLSDVTINASDLLNQIAMVQIVRLGTARRPS